MTRSVLHNITYKLTSWLTILCQFVTQLSRGTIHYMQTFIYKFIKHVSMGQSLGAKLQPFIPILSHLSIPWSPFYFWIPFIIPKPFLYTRENMKSFAVIWDKKELMDDRGWLKVGLWRSWSVEFKRKSPSSNYIWYLFIHYSWNYHYTIVPLYCIILHAVNCSERTVHLGFMPKL